MAISTETRQRMLCAYTKSRLQKNSEYLENTEHTDIRYPIVDEISILIANDKGLFSKI